jgi:hypothetical protein
MKNIAFLYFGDLRTFRHVHTNHNQHVFDPLRSAGYICDIYMHTWHKNENTPDTLKYIRDVLSPVYFVEENQQEFETYIALDNLFDQKLWDLKGDSEDGEWPINLLRNHLCALESLRRVYGAFEKQQHKMLSDLVCVIRPDLWFFSAINPCVISGICGNTDAIAIPNFASFGGYNDRMAIGGKNAIRVYAQRSSCLLEFRRTQGRISSERVLKFALDKNHIKPHHLDISFEICRSDHLTTTARFVSKIYLPPIIYNYAQEHAYVTYCQIMNSSSSVLICYMPVLEMLSSECQVIAEFGSGDMNSSYALLWGLMKNSSAETKDIYCVDINHSTHFDTFSRLAADVSVKATFFQVSSVHANFIRRIDLLFINTLCDYDLLKHELEKHAFYVNKYIVIHGTYLHATPGIDRAIQEFLDVNTDTWCLYRDFKTNAGLCVFKRVSYISIPEPLYTYTQSALNYFKC